MNNEHENTTMSENHVETRLGKVEQEVASVKTDVRYIRSALDTMADNQRDSNKNNKTNWGTLAAWAAVILALASYHTNLSNQAALVVQENHNAQLIRLWDRNDRNEQWRSTDRARISVLESMIEGHEESYRNLTRGHPHNDS